MTILSIVNITPTCSTHAHSVITCCWYIRQFSLMILAVSKSVHLTFMMPAQHYTNDTIICNRGSLCSCRATHPICEDCITLFTYRKLHACARSSIYHLPNWLGMFAWQFCSVPQYRLYMHDTCHWLSLAGLSLWWGKGGNSSFCALIMCSQDYGTGPSRKLQPSIMHFRKDSTQSTKHWKIMLKSPIAMTALYTRLYTLSQIDCALVWSY